MMRIVNSFFMTVGSLSNLESAAGAAAGADGRAAGAAGADGRAAGRRGAAGDRGAHATRPDGLDRFKVHERLAVVEQGAKLVVLRIREVALRLDHFVVRRHADVELALHRVEPLLRELARRRRG